VAEAVAAAPLIGNGDGVFRSDGFGNGTAFGEPAEDRSEQFARLRHFCAVAANLVKTS
jgi:hypothetical protein